MYISSSLIIGFAFVWVFVICSPVFIICERRKDVKQKVILQENNNNKSKIVIVDVLFLS